MVYDHDCDRCPLSRSARSVCVEGAPGAFLGLEGVHPAFVLHEVPKRREGGKRSQEDILLAEALSEEGLVSVFHSAAVKCAGTSAQPNKRSVDACRIYLNSEIRALKPACILAMGRLAAMAVKRPGLVRDQRGTLTWYNKVPCIVTWNLQTALNDTTKGAQWREDFAIFAALTRLERGD